MDAIEDDERKPLPRTHSTNQSSPKSNPNPSFPVTHNLRFMKYEPDHQQPRREDAHEGEEFAAGNGYSSALPMHRKKQKMDESGMFVSGNEWSFAPTSPSSNWTEYADSVLLEVYGKKFRQLGKTDLGPDEWWEVAEKVSEESKIGFTRAQCRIRLDELKKKFKGEKIRTEAVGGGRSTSKCAFFEKMDALIGSWWNQNCSLPCGIDSGNYAFLGSSGLDDEMRDSDSETEDDELKTKGDEAMDSEVSLLKSVSDSILKFGRLYEKVERRKCQKMMELEKMRMDFAMELEMQKRQLMERSMAEIAKLQQDDGNGG